MNYKEEKYIDFDGQELTKKVWNSGDIWYTNKEGKWHRLDGLSIIWPDGLEYWLNGENVSKREIDLIWLRKQVEE